MKNRGIAIVLVFFLGGFGVHKFYLGNNFAGVLYLVFFWTFIPSILAIFDFFGLLLMSAQAFNAQYNFISGSSPSQFTFESTKDKVATLNELKKLYDNGIITAEEYEEKRRKFLDSI
ncbi:MAG: NINE protein [Cyanobacterium sp. T60_A2020_053]|nr:NINE protein [Cyanobacterium sp. T60_A2020_053]